MPWEIVVQVCSAPPQRSGVFTPDQFASLYESSTGLLAGRIIIREMRKRAAPSERNSEPVADGGKFGVGGIGVDEQPVGIRAQQRRTAGQRQRDQSDHCDHLHASPRSIAQVCPVHLCPASTFRRRSLVALPT